MNALNDQSVILTAKSCELFDLPFHQFAKLKQFAPELIDPIKADYKRHWQIWKILVEQVAQELGADFAPPHIEKWCNGWQVRAHFFAFFKWRIHEQNASILSLILNRRRLQICLDWHSYRANRSVSQLRHYNQWVEHFDPQHYANYQIWHGADSEYGDFQNAEAWRAQDFKFTQDNDFYCIGKNIEKADLASVDSKSVIVQSIRQLLPLYAQTHQI